QRMQTACWQLCFSDRFTGARNPARLPTTIQSRRIRCAPTRVLVGTTLLFYHRPSCGTLSPISMRTPVLALSLCACMSLAQEPAAPDSTKTTPPPPDPVALMAGRLDLEAYKAVIKGLTKFGDRRQGTDRNRAALDWIEAQLKSNGCTNTERVH